MSSDGSVTLWICQLKAGNHEAAQQLWDRYYRKMVSLARVRLGSGPRGVTDGEDAASRAFYSFCLGAENGRFPQLRDRDNLWPLLVKITARKVIDAREHENCQKRGGGAAKEDAARIEQVIGAEPSPAFAAEMADQVRHLLDSLGSEELRKVAEWKMEGYTNRDIADKLGCVERSVERRLNIIRVRLEREMQS